MGALRIHGWVGLTSSDVPGILGRMREPSVPAAAPGVDRAATHVRGAGRTGVDRLLVGVAGRAVHPDDVLAGNPTALLGTLWWTGGAWLVLAAALGGFSGGRPALALAVGAVALVVGTVLRLLRGRPLPVPGNVALTLLGSVAIIVAVVAGGRGVSAAAAGVLFVYVTCFAFVAVPGQAVATIVVSAGGHLLALLLLGVEDAVPVWGLTWGTATVAGLLAGGVVRRLVEATEQLRAADVAKDRFVATVSHELRSPLAAILGAVETLRDHDGDLPTEVRHRLLAVVQRQALRQQRLGEDVLLLAQRSAGAGAPRPTAVDLVPLVRDALEVVDVEVGFEPRDVPSVLADPMHVQRVVENLLVNAARYGAPPVEVRVEHDGDVVVLEVVDHGSGIPGGFAAGALEPFRQSERDAGGGPGVGLGLAIVQDLVTANGGRLSYRDTPGGGATVRTEWRTN